MGRCGYHGRVFEVETRDLWDCKYHGKNRCRLERRQGEILLKAALEEEQAEWDRLENEELW